MAEREREREIAYAVLNVVATPHPVGVYYNILKLAAKKPVNVWGDQYGSITNAEEIESGFFRGALVLWTQIDHNEPAVLIDSLKEVPYDQIEADIPDNIGFNGKVFLWIFRIDNHSMFVEIRNELGKTLSASRAAAFFSKLFSPDMLGLDAPHVDVTLIPSEDTIEKILSIPKLKQLEIHVKRPNPDDVSNEAKRVLKRLEDMGAKSQDETFTAHSGEDLKPDADATLLARVAAFNGYVKVRGVEGGKRIVRSTKEYPRIVKRAASKFASAASAALSVAKETILRL